MEKKKERIFGVETEYSLAINAGREINDAMELEILDVFAESLPFLIRPNTGFSRAEGEDMLVNQARAYRDSPGRHPEYATQECNNVFDLIACEKAGERHFGRALTDLRLSLSRFYPGVSVRLFKNNRAFAEKYKNAEAQGGEFVSYGEHLNYLIKCSVKSADLQRLFIPHLIALSVITGGGAVDFSVPENRFVFKRSQRLPFMERPIGVSATLNRSYIVIRDPLSDYYGPYNRIEILASDSSLFEPAMLLKHALSLAVLNMLEDDGFYYSYLQPLVNDKFQWVFLQEDLCKASMAAPSLGLDDKLPIRGYAWTLRSLADFFADLRNIYAEKVGFGADIMKGIELERSLLDLLDENRGIDESLFLHPYCDYAFMKLIMEADMAKYGYGWKSPPGQLISVESSGGKTFPVKVSTRLHFFEFMCHEINPDISLFDKADRSGLVKHIIEPETIVSMEIGAPATTRANRRKTIVDRLRNVSDLKYCYWTSAGSKSGIFWDLSDPFFFELTPKDDEKFIQWMSARLRKG